METFLDISQIVIVTISLLLFLSIVGYVAALVTDFAIDHWVKVKNKYFSKQQKKEDQNAGDKKGRKEKRKEER